MVDRLATGLHERGHEVTLLTAGPVVQNRPYRIVESSGRLRQYVTNPVTATRLGPHDVVVDVCNGVPFFTPAWTRTPVVLLVNHIHFGMWREWFSSPVALVGSSIETRLMPLLYRRRHVVAVSDSTAKALATLGIPADNISLVHNGVELATVGHRTTPRATEPTFLAVGRLVPHKRFDLLLRAWARVQPAVGGRLLVAGDGPERDALAADLPEGATLLGRVTEDEKRALMESAWLLVQPSRLEGWGLVVMEAAAAGTPTLGFWAPGTRDAVDHETSGVLVRTETQLVDEWIGLAKDHERRRVLAKGAVERAMAFSWERTVDDFEQVLERARREPRPAARALPALVPSAQASRRSLRRSLATKAGLFRLFLSEKTNSTPFYLRLADESVAALPYRLEGRRVLDLGSGAGEMTDALRRAGANAVSVDLAEESLLASQTHDGRACADGRTLPFPDGSFDGVVCSNMLEHTPDPAPILHEIARVLAPGGWAWVSWTNWYSPWGGHEIVPFHYLGPNLGHRLWTRCFGAVRKNVPFDGLWPTFVSQVLKMAQAHPALEVRDVYPRYYPSQRWVVRTPVLRELLTWNCVVLMERRPHVPLDPDPPLAVGAHGPRAAIRSALRRARQALGDHPVFLPILLRATPLGTSRRITNETELVIEGYPRSGNTFAHFAVLHAEPGAVVTSRVHTPSQVKLAVRRRTPTLLAIRQPLDAVTSTMVAAPHIEIRTLLLEYIHHYEQLIPHLDRVVVATFDEITEDFDEVIAVLNEQFSLGLRPFGHTPEHVEEVFAAIRAHHHEHWGDDQTRLPLPTDRLRAHKRRVRAEVLRAEHAALLHEAQTIYETVAARSVTSRRGAIPSALSLEDTVHA